MSNRTFACLDCKKLQRKDQNIPAFFCPHCGKESIRVHWKLRVPSPRKIKKWNSFWSRYLSELRQLKEFYTGRGAARLYLPLLNQEHRRND
ncbi:hypothetical protein [Undibacterium sp. KW1]|uniref:hypothetical protein n=2 Tax=unclassified Undibacterium TaxID=2630295 RepID=UPI00138A5C5B|nr:hypothetical protein [Undibacterium sp. KW1]